MNNKAVAVGIGVLAGVIAWQAIPPKRRHRYGAAVRRGMIKRMEKMMAEMPEQSPPKLIMSVLPRVREQNEEIIALLREQNALLEQQRQTRQ